MFHDLYEAAHFRSKLSFLLFRYACEVETVSMLFPLFISKFGFS